MSGSCRNSGTALTSKLQYYSLLSAFDSKSYFACVCLIVGEAKKELVGQGPCVQENMHINLYLCIGCHLSIMLEIEI